MTTRTSADNGDAVNAAFDEVYTGPPHPEAHGARERGRPPSEARRRDQAHPAYVRAFTTGITSSRWRRTSVGNRVFVPRTIDYFFSKDHEGNK